MARRRQSRSAVFRHPEITPIFSDKDRAAKAAALLDRVDEVSYLFKMIAIIGNPIVLL